MPIMKSDNQVPAHDAMLGRSEDDDENKYEFNYKYICIDKSQIRASNGLYRPGFTPTLKSSSVGTIGRVRIS